MVRNRWHGRGIPMFFWLPFAIGIPGAYLFFQWLETLVR